MASKYSSQDPRSGDVTFWIAAVSALILLAVVISSAVVYFIGASLPYAG
jgi:hypothetical protein